MPGKLAAARYAGPDGIDRPAPDTFATKNEAEIWLTLKEAEIRNSDWINPDDGKVSLSRSTPQPGSMNGRACGPRPSICTATSCAST